ncbi:hypothetical protein SmJEL517_g04744 [Synchytrium microbalum]|uniref:Tyrosine-protein kinase ephrin type A/B receptor-like domain-containing protein n=1 Tax=Synchytrium microbalum TaxID=1806994 RepID=A0A507BX97_9FUNG|nr:uncharacterized protein SmJEL517_g04744 [Synchytrium microbalum]TPX32052.1 hypothetical protein SmJEL517_g04744 [Synchytrium microbalum]
MISPNAVIQWKFSMWICSIALFLPCTLSQQVLLNPVTSQPTCGSSQYWDITLSACNTCTVSQNSSSTGVCSCQAGYTKTIGNSAPTCTACGAGQTSSPDRSWCVSCPTTYTTAADGSVLCTCPALQYLALRNAAGTQLATGVCTACPFGSYPSSDMTTCISCPDYNMLASFDATTSSYICTCRQDVGGYLATPVSNVCITTAESAAVSTTGAGTVTYYNIPSGTMTITNTLLTSMYLRAASKCQYEWDVASCELLGNLCILNLYDESTAPCATYERVAAQRPGTGSTVDVPQYMPWLYYGLLGSHVDPATTLSARLNLSLSVRYSDTTTTSIPFYLAMYTLNGTFLGMQPLTTQLQFCEGSSLNNRKSWTGVGRNYQSSCKLNLASLLSGFVSTVFYEIYVLDGTGSYAPVPIRLLDFRNSNGYVNPSGGPNAITGDRFVRRFFMVDVTSGQTTAGATPQVIRVASSIQIWIQLNPSYSGNVYIPVVDIKYIERDVSTLSVSDTSSVSVPTLSFTVTHMMPMDGFWRNMTIAFAIVQVFAGLLGLYRAQTWSQRNLGPQDAMDLGFLGRSVITLGGRMGVFGFWLLFGTGIYFLCFFKGESGLTVMLPYSSGDMITFNAALAGIFTLQLIYVMREVYGQCTIDVFFIDWEKSRGKSFDPIDPVHSSRARAAAISVWRSIFVANQWNALQIYRRLNIEFCLFWVYFILQGCGVRYAATPQPDIYDLTPAIVHPVLLFGVNSLIWLFVAFVLIVLRFGVYERFYRHPLLQFVDLCSVANVSVLLFDEPGHGYYIHGRSVHSYADTDMAELYHQLRKEESNVVPRRGLNDTEEQSFEIFVSKGMRETYDHVYGLLIAKDAEMKFNDRNVRSGHARPKAAGGEHTVKAYETINRFLCAFFDKNLKEFPYYVRPRTFTERMIHTTPDLSLGSVFFHDETSFGHVLLQGMEYDMFILAMLTYNIVDVTTNSPTAAGLATIMVDVVLRAARKYFGERNVAQKSLLDVRFLL